MSKHDETELFAKTSGDISLKMWFVARYRNIRAGVNTASQLLEIIIAEGAKMAPSFFESTLLCTAISSTRRPYIKSVLVN